MLGCWLNPDRDRLDQTEVDHVAHTQTSKHFGFQLRADIELVNFAE